MKKTSRAEFLEMMEGMGREDQAVLSGWGERASAERNRIHVADVFIANLVQSVGRGDGGRVERQHSDAEIRGDGRR